MIYTVTLNPSLDRIVDIDEFIYDDVNRILEEKRLVSGKAIYVSRVIRGLGGHTCLMGLVGGYNGLEVEGRLISEGIVCDLAKIKAETRTNIVIHQRRKKLQTLFSASDPEVAPPELAIFYSKLSDIPRDSYVVLSGTLPAGVSDNFYAQIITSLAGKNVRVIVDADGAVLKRSVVANPFLIKPNIHEFGRLVEKNVKEVQDVIENVEPYLSHTHYIVVSMGARGVVAASQSERYHIVPPKVNVKSQMGAGDALVGGLVYALSAGSSFVDALTLGVACGTSSTLNAAGAFPSRDEVETIRKEVLVKTI